ncbi:MAG TPA: 3-oxoacyl-[acyl-carrier-protein] synthase III C-terminal domain-containing protein, partial [Thermoanaerobaculaceae bacterium]|nr:3-oxoacyl-[acyl-carrier-protein] synthase III C-terminal domain-containing protein [Thermoanaerobaculaceae bacterium]
SARFLSRLPDVIFFPREAVLDLSGGLADTLSTSVFLGLHQALQDRLLGPAKVALLLACGSGITVGAATYRF